MSTEQVLSPKGGRWESPSLRDPKTASESSQQSTIIWPNYSREEIVDVRHSLRILRETFPADSDYTETRGTLFKAANMLTDLARAADVEEALTRQEHECTLVETGRGLAKEEFDAQVKVESERLAKQLLADLAEIAKNSKRRKRDQARLKAVKPAKKEAKRG